MPEPGILPTPEAFGNALSDLLGKGVHAKKGAAMRLPPPGPFVLATYKSDDGKQAVVWVCDLPLASAAGAALSLIPRVVAAESARAGKLSETLAENVHEIFNVCTSLLNQPYGPHFVLDRVSLPPVTLSGDLAGPMAKPLERDDFELAIEGYDAGKLSGWRVALLSELPNVAGSWELTAEGRDGPMTQTLTIQQTGSTIKGALGGPTADATFEGTIAGNKISFTVRRETPNGVFSLEYSAVLDGDSMIGTIHTARVDMKFTAKRGK